MALHLVSDKVVGDIRRIEWAGSLNLLGVQKDSNFTVTPGPWKDYLEAKFGRDLTNPDHVVESTHGTSLPTRQEPPSQ